MDLGFVAIRCPDCGNCFLHYHKRWIRKDVVRCGKGCGFEKFSYEFLDEVGDNLYRTQVKLESEKIRAKTRGVHVKLDGVSTSTSKKALLDAIFKFHPDRNPQGLDANEVLMVLNKLKGML